MSGPRVLIIGAGFGGIAAAIDLQAHGFDEITIVDRAEGCGGTWLHNDYPGAACDVPSHLYSYSFAQRRDWSRLCSPQDEILAYLREVVRDHGLERRMELGTEVTSCRWDDESRTWKTTAAGRPHLGERRGDRRDRAAPPRGLSEHPRHRHASRATRSIPPPGTTTTT